MFHWAEINKKNKILIATHLSLQSILLVSYFFMSAFRLEGYQPDIYKKMYVCFMTWGVFLFSILIVLWEIKGNYHKRIIEILVGVMIFSFSSLPLILIIFSVGRLNGINFILPLILQMLWGIVILSIKNLLINMKVSMWYIKYLLFIFVITVLLISMIFLFFYVQYAQLVITTIYDKDIPIFFFTNPLISIMGLSHVQVGGSTQMQYRPVLFFLVCWTVFSTAINITAYRFSKLRRINHE
ncbi:hypothetical protein SAMN02745883_01172 [Caminicella sporogenes DSM 14501]|uniref:Uncharacterized protein n=1 Tax=Caminicella sporogenes DSM 14501 TaxID=1121266 RepID=A0A1M6PEM0_9FIRM|nr:hypothetical protein [Caminicella sporogenes]RKD21428.1 hypothetical protein BET04_08295 [Caminicella sporogenes]SHK06361.1 hypothetical protein SAMN02745883_01172 [Caminicella sporogenes DSM 14501]